MSGNVNIGLPLNKISLGSFGASSITRNANEQQQFKKLVIDPGAAKDFEGPFKSQPKDGKTEDNQSYNPLAPKPSKLENTPNSLGSNSTSEESPEI